jgi:hypothetical protein
MTNGTFNDTPPSAAQCCQPSPCEASAKKQKALAESSQKTMDKFLEPQFSNTPCGQKAQTLNEQGTVQQYKTFTDAMPYAHAANALNQLGDKDISPPTKNCITMLPQSGAGLTQALGLPEGTIVDNDLRDDETGFRAALFKNEADGSLILVARDTQPDSLVDWKTNTDNGQGRDSEQYESMRNLAGIIDDENIDFNLSGYSKGGGLAQEAGLVAKNAQVKVFNSAGLHGASLTRTGSTNFDALSARTQSFSAQGDFLTFMNNTEDDTQQLANAEFLRDELAGDGAGINPMKLKVRNPAMRQAIDDAGWFGDDPDPGFADARDTYLQDIDDMIDNARDAMTEEATLALKQKRPVNNVLQMFPPVRAHEHVTLPNSIPGYNWEGKVNNPNPNLAKLIQHKMSNVVDGLTGTIKQDEKALKKFVKSCG